MNLVVRMLPFALVATSLMAAIHYFLWIRLGRDPAWPAPWPDVLRYSLLTIAVLLPMGMMFGRVLPAAISDPLAWPIFVWLGVMFYLLLGTLAAEPIRWLLRSAPVDEERRQLFARSVALLVGCGASVAVAIGAKNALSALHVKEVTVKLDKLPQSLDGLKLVQVSDIHVGPTIGRRFVEEMVRQINALEPDIIAVTGDLVDGTVEKLAHAVAPLAELRAKHGRFFVTGNHEYYSDAEAWVAKVRSLGLTVLRNERVSIGSGSDLIDVAGVDDYDSGRFSEGPQMKAALHGRDPQRALVLLAHQPRAFKEACEQGVCLTLSGHTHAGQMWPWNHAVKLQTEYIVGLYEAGASQLYVSPGTGYWGPPVRVGTQAEITLLTLKAA